MKTPPEYNIQKHSFNLAAIEQLYNYDFAEEFWPVVYLLKEKNQRNAAAYVGETIDITTRLATHLNHPDKGKLHEAYLISSKQFNKSATLDIEANCIKYLSGDGMYKLLNANLGLVNHSYYQKEELYDEIFQSVWDRFRSLGVAKHTLQQIDNSDLFKYSPYKSLSSEQTKSLILILESLLDDRYKSFVIEGGAGSGKTVLAVFLFKLLHTAEENFDFSAFGPEDQRIVKLVQRLKQKLPNPKMALIIPMNSFRATVQTIFRHVEGLRADMVVGPADLKRNYYDIVVVDEAHRLRRRENLGYYGFFDEVSNELGLDKDKDDELDWVLRRSDRNIFFYDEFQSIKPSDVLQEKFDILKNDKRTRTNYLHSQFRVKGGLRYVKLIDQLLKCDPPFSREKVRFKKYDFLLFDDLAQMVDVIKKKDQKKQLARVVAGYAWPWRSKKNKKAIDINIGPVKLRWNTVNKNWINSENAINEVGCIHTVQGYDLNYTGIIFGNEIGYDKEKGQIFIRKDNYHDRNGKNGVKNAEQLKRFIINIYKTLMLRGIKGTYLYICDDALREYLARYIPFYNEPVTNDFLSEKKIIPFVNSVPLYDLKAAAGNFSEQQPVIDDVQWFLIQPQKSLRISKDHFACKVVGESMNKLIPNGAICLFRKYAAGTRNGKIVLVSHTGIQDADFGSNYTVKKYFSEKKYNGDGTWEHERVILKPFSDDPSYEDIVLEENEFSRLKVIGIFEAVLGS